MQCGFLSDINKHGSGDYVQTGHKLRTRTHLAGWNASSPGLRRVIQSLNIVFPHLLIYTLQSPIISQQTIHLAFYICCLRPDPSTAWKSRDLIFEFSQKKVATVVPNVKIIGHLVSLVDWVDGVDVVPQATSINWLIVPVGAIDLLLDRNICANTAKFTLDCNSAWVMRTWLYGVERCATLRVWVMMIVAEVAMPVVNPSGRRVNQPCRIQLANSLR